MIDALDAVIVDGDVRIHASLRLTEDCSIDLDLLMSEYRHSGKSLRFVPCCAVEKMMLECD